MTLPPCIVLQSVVFDQKYLQYVKENGEIYSFLKSNGDSVASPCSKFEVEKSRKGNRLVHIRCCYNNKYWVRLSSSSSWIVAGADKAEEDQSKWSCTLFEPIDVDSKDCTIRLRHVQLNRYACLDQGTTHRSSCLDAKSSDPNKEKSDIFTFIDWSKLVIMPKYVAFGDDNDHYLCPTTIDNVTYLAFDLDEIQDHKAQNEVFATSNGSLRIKSSVVSKFWRRSSADLICPDSDGADGDEDTLFWPVKTSDKVVALKNLGNDLYCKRITEEEKEDCLNAAASTIVKDVKMKVYELVQSRCINDVNFRLSDARIYSESQITLATEEATNDSDETKTVEVKLRYTETKTSIWDSNVSLKLGVATTIKTGVPFIKAGEKVGIEEYYEGTYGWGESKTSTKEIEKKYKITIKPRSTVTVTLSATKGWCDVPFSYTQTDTLTAGTTITDDKDDGFYTGINCFDLKYETKEEKQ